MTASKTKWVRLGEYIELCDERNAEGKYGVKNVRGMTINKEIIPTKADLKESSDLSKFLVVQPKEFVYNPRTHGKRIGLGFNNTSKPFIISWNNIAFRSINQKSLLSEYLYLIICREEWDRNACFRSWGSSTEVFSWTEFTMMQIPLPPIDVQRELVAAYEGLKRLAEDNEALIAPLTSACQAFIVDCKRKYKEVQLGELIEEVDERNSEGTDYPFCGVNKDKTFMPTVADTNNLDNRKYKLVKQDTFVFSGMQTGRDVCIRIALQNNEKNILVSPAYTTFKVKDTSKILPQYLFLQFNRLEMDRLGWFLSDGSIRSNLDWDRFTEIRIPLPPMDVQQSIVRLYRCIEEARSIANDAREQLRTLCPALVQKAINS